MSDISSILTKDAISSSDILRFLQCEGDELPELLQAGGAIKKLYVGNRIYLRGLIEFSNVCQKDCLYCGIRRSNNLVQRYSLTDDDVLKAARFADENRFGSIVLQSGENSSPAFVNRLTNLISQIKKNSDGRLGITLSVGEQPEMVYREWFEAGAHRYLLRIETTNQLLYSKIHPQDPQHDFKKRLDCLYSLQTIGYQTGTGVMIGLPFQTVDDLVNDLLFFQQFGIDMVGMGPYIEHTDTPLYALRDELMPVRKRFDLTLKMIAVLRILMKDINIAATTALQAIDPFGREKGIMAGANVMMPNITPGFYRNNYRLYDNKPCVDEEPEMCAGCLDARIAMADGEISYGEWGDSIHFERRNKSRSDS